MKLPELSQKGRIAAVAVGVIAIGVAIALVGGLSGKRGGSSGVEPLVLNDADQKAMAEYGYAVIDRYFDPSLPEPKPPSVSGLTPSNYDQLFSTLLSNGKIRCSWGSGSDMKDDAGRVAADIKEAVTKCIEDKRFGGVLKKEEADDVDLVFNLLYGKRRVAKNDLKYQKNKIDLGIHALLLQAGKKSAFFKESVAISKNYDHKKMLQRLCKKAKQDKDCAQSDKVKLYKYETTTFKSNRNLETVDLFRYNTLVEPEDVTLERTKEAIRLASHWFSNNLKPNGMPEYLYFPSSDRYSKSDNDIRRLGTLWSMTEADAFLGRNDFRKAVDVTLGHYLTGLRVNGAKVDYREIGADDEGLLIPDGDRKIAYAAFTIYSLINTKDFPNRDNLMRALGNGLISQQRDDGSLRTYVNSDKTGGEDFYPGEVLFALAWLHHETGDAKYLEAVKKAFPFYRDYWRKNKNTPFVPWHSRADRYLYEATKDPEVAEFVYEMQDYIWGMQIKEHEYPDVIGGIGKRGNPQMSTCTYSEGLGDAVHVAKMAGNEKRHQEFTEKFRMAARFILQLQYTEENLFYLENPKRALGGFRGTLTNNAQRNDYTQHCTLALIKLVETGVVQ